jgi:hypothetical protein
MTLDVYRASAAAPIAAALAPNAAPFTIEVRFRGGLAESHRAAFRAAADRWTRVIVGDLPSVTVDHEVIDDVVVLAGGAEIDGSGQVLGQAGPTRLRPKSAGTAALLPAKGEMTFDVRGLASLERASMLVDVITHEMGHVLGIGTLWARKGLLAGAGTGDPTFVGGGAMAAYGALRGQGPLPVPVESAGHTGTRDSHWRETIFRSELMSGFVTGRANPISRVTVASLRDLGYVVDLDAADAFVLPAPLAAPHVADAPPRIPPLDVGVMLPHVALVLPDDALAV